MATSLPWHPLLSSKSQRRHIHPRRLPHRSTATIQAFRRSDFDGFAKPMASGEVWRDAWRSANNGFEQLLYETRKTAERIDRRYSISRRLSAVAQSAADRARELDREFEITQQWRTLTLDFSRNFPRYRKQFNDFLDTPIGRSFAGACPACKRQFVGYKNQTVRCASCGNIVWQPQGDFFSRGRGGDTPSKSQPEAIDVEFEEK